MTRRIITKLQTGAEDQPMPQSDEEVLQVVSQLVEALPDPQREIFLRHQQGEPFWQIADSMGLGRKVVLKALSKIYSNLRFILMPEKDASSAYETALPQQSL
jgi:DNA-directed RNA polymerase specialized sigma24 family protein